MDNTYRIAHRQDETYYKNCDTERMDTPGERLRRARLAKRYETATDAAEAFGWNEATYRSHENGTRGIKPPMAARYGKALGVEASWILFGSGAPPQVAPASPSFYEPQPNAIIEGPAQLPAPTRIRDIEELGVTMGGDGEDDSVFALNGQVIDRVMRPQGLLNRKNVFALRVASTSMSPKFEEGDRIYVEQMDTPAIGDYIVIELKPTREDEPGKSFIKRLVSRKGNVWKTEQFNPHGYLEFSRNEILRIFRVFPMRELLGEG